MAGIIEKIIKFVDNGGRFQEGREPVYGEPFYGDYIKQYMSTHYKPGDRISVLTDDEFCEGVILNFNYFLELLTSGRRVHKNKRNKKKIWYGNIQTIELIKEDDGTFDLAAVNPDEWEQMNKKDEMFSFLNDKSEVDRNIRNKDRDAFNQVYPNVNFEKSHVIQINNGCELYWPFEHNGISAEVFMVRDDDKITKIPCKTGALLPNENSYHACNYTSPKKYPELFLYLPDNGFIYEDVNIVCVWTINTDVSGEEMAIKVVNIHHVGEVKPVEDNHNMIFIDMSVSPLLGHGSSLFNNSRNVCLLTHMMNEDMYVILNRKEDNGVIVKKTNLQSEEDVEKYIYMATLGVDEFNLQNVIHYLVEDYKDFPFVEVFCNIDKEPDRYYSRAWRRCRKEFEFKMLSTRSE